MPQAVSHSLRLSLCLCSTESNIPGLCRAGSPAQRRRLLEAEPPTQPLAMSMASSPCPRPLAVVSSTDMGMSAVWGQQPCTLAGSCRCGEAQRDEERVRKGWMDGCGRSCRGAGEGPFQKLWEGAHSVFPTLVPPMTPQSPPLEFCYGMRVSTVGLLPRLGEGCSRPCPALAACPGHGQPLSVGAAHPDGDGWGRGVGLVSTFPEKCKQ